MSRKTQHLLKYFFISFFAVTYLFFASEYFTKRKIIPPTLEAKNQTQPNSTEKVIRVIDGDTIEIEGGIKVRLTGIDTPELRNRNKTVDCFAKEAKSYTEKLLLGKQISLEKDVSETDKYGRLLRYVYLDNNLFNESLVREGYAKTATFPPDVSKADLFVKAETYARENKLGLWAKCQ